MYKYVFVSLKSQSSTLIIQPTLQTKELFAFHQLYVDTTLLEHVCYIFNVVILEEGYPCYSVSLTQ